MSTSAPAGGARPQTPPPAFSQAELRRRRRALVTAAEADVVVAYGANRTGSAVPWLTTWPVTREAGFLLSGDGPGRLLVGFGNHVPNARDVVARAGLGDSVEPLGEAPAATVAGVLARAGLRGTVALVGPVPPWLRHVLEARFARVVDLDRAYARLRMVKSDEELQWLSYAAVLTDRAAAALVDAAADGASEQEMVAAAEHAYRPAGGSHHICYVSTTPMDDPDRCVPAQWPTGRRTARGSAVVFELSAGWGPDYPAQLLRTVTVGTPPTPLYEHLHAVAEHVHGDVLARLRAGTPPRDLLEVLGDVRDEGLTTVDHLVHGLGGGYLPPVLGGSTCTPRGLHAEPLRPGTALVVQPNICTPDLRAGVQTGEMVVVTETGARSLHCFTPGLLTVPYRRVEAEEGR